MSLVSNQLIAPLPLVARISTETLLCDRQSHCCCLLPLTVVANEANSSSSSKPGDMSKWPDDSAKPIGSRARLEWRTGRLVPIAFICSPGGTWPSSPSWLEPGARPPPPFASLAHPTNRHRLATPSCRLWLVLAGGGHRSASNCSPLISCTKRLTG